MQWHADFVIVMISPFQGWQVFAGSWKQPVYSMEKIVQAKIVLQTFARWEK
jgi:hypothetical protein